MKIAPIMRLDRQFLNAVELRIAELALFQLAEIINGIGKGGGIYGTLILPPDQAAMKQRAMQGGG